MFRGFQFSAINPSYFCSHVTTAGKSDVIVSASYHVKLDRSTTYYARYWMIMGVTGIGADLEGLEPPKYLGQGARSVDEPRNNQHKL
jgi:hypothetical protein